MEDSLFREEEEEELYSAYSVTIWSRRSAMMRLVRIKTTQLQLQSVNSDFKFPQITALKPITCVYIYYTMTAHNYV